MTGWTKAAFIAVLIVAPPSFAANPAVPVKVGGDPVRPACADVGVLNDREAVEGGVEVRSGPARSFNVLDRLPVETPVFTCDESGTFLGVIYGDAECGLAESIERRATYRGTCASGWVHNRSIDTAPPA